MVAEYKIDRSGWSPGPWDDEPEDLVIWQTSVELPAVAVRQSRYGTWAGYVGVRPGHPATMRARGHRGTAAARVAAIRSRVEITWLDADFPREDVPGIPEGFWWVGFHCMYGTDAAPWLPAEINQRIGGAYRGLTYVRAECERLSSQLVAMARGTA